LVTIFSRATAAEIDGIEQENGMLHELASTFMPEMWFFANPGLDARKTHHRP
jgi:hypothetical protein